MIVVAGTPRDGQMMIVSKMTATATPSVRIAISVSRIKATVSQAIVPAARSVLTRTSVSPIKASAAKTSAPATRNVRTAINVSLTRATVGRATTLVQDRHLAPHHRATEAPEEHIRSDHQLRRQLCALSLYNKLAQRDYVPSIMHSIASSGVPMNVRPVWSCTVM